MTNDRVTLGAVTGLAGGLAKTALDEMSLRLKISQRSFHSTSTGVWVNTEKEATSLNWQNLGQILDTKMSMLGGIVVFKLLTMTGRDKLR